MIERDGMLYAVNEFITPEAGEVPFDQDGCGTAPSATRR